MPKSRVSTGVSTWTCQACGIECTRPNTRGQRPKWCADCRARSAWQHSSGVCQGCGKTFTGTGKKFCSVPCAARTNAEARRKPKPPTKPRSEPKPKICVIFTPNCYTCGRVFVTRFTTATCSPECREAKRLSDKRDQRHRRRALERGAFVAPVHRLKIYERDGWVCGICGDPVNRQASVPELDAPTIDHVVPLARGGSHEPSNCQTAHFYCNSVKSDRLAA